MKVNSTISGLEPLMSIEAVGPAGAGKTTAMHALQRAWRAEHGRDSVVGLAPSAVAAQVLAEDLGIECENTAKWLHEHDRGRVALHADQLVIIDEATLAGTLTLDRISRVAAEAGAKVLLVGDWAQLQSVDAGGAFSLLVSERPDVAELTEVHRFVSAWEREASLDLRFGRSEVIGLYAEHDRLREGTTDEMTDAASAAWRADTRSGRSSVLVTGQRDRSSSSTSGPEPNGSSTATRGPALRCASSTAVTPRKATSSSPGATTAGSSHCEVAGCATAIGGRS